MVSQRLQQRILDILARERALSRSVLRLEDETRVFEFDQDRFFAHYNARALRHRRRSAPDTRRRHCLVTEAINSHHSTDFGRPEPEFQDGIEATFDNEWDAPRSQHPDSDDLSSDYSSQAVRPRAVAEDDTAIALNDGVRALPRHRDLVPDTRRHQHPVAQALHSFHSVILERPRPHPDGNAPSSHILIPRVAVQDDPRLDLNDEQAMHISEAVREPEAGINASRPARIRQKRRHVTFAEDDYIFNSSDDVSTGPGVPTDDVNIPCIRSAYTGEGHIAKRIRRDSGEPVPLPQLPTQHESSRATHQPYVGIWNPRHLAGGPIKPITREEYDGLNARADEVESRTPCPYPDCGKMFEAVQSKDRHLRRDHPDWCIVMDQVNREAMY